MNHEDKTSNYRVEAVVNGETIGRTEAVTLDDGEMLQDEIILGWPEQGTVALGTSQKVEFTLFREEQPYRSLHLWIQFGGFQCCNRNTKFTWYEGDHILMSASWNAPERAGGFYSSDKWPRGSLATTRILMFAARQVLRDEWDINSIIASKNTGGSFAVISDVETNFWQGHEDFPPHINLNYVLPDWSGM